MANATAKDDWPSPVVGWYLVALLFIGQTVSFIDRQLIALLVEDIKLSFGLNDFEIGLLQGLPFGIFYSTMLIPIAVAADRASRRNIIVAGVSFWSFATALCGLATNFWQLFLARIGVGVGEATLQPSAYSLISDHFPKEKLAFPMGVFSMGNLAGVGLAMVLGGAVYGWALSLGGVDLWLVGHLEPWQFTFVLVGLPGLVVACMFFTVREPRRRGASRDGQATFADFARFVSKERATFIPMFAMVALLALVSYANFSWLVVYLMRDFGWTAPQAGAYFGAIVAVCGSAGSVSGGLLAGWMTRRGHRDALHRTLVFTQLPVAPLAVLCFVWAPSATWALLFYAPVAFLAATPGGVGATALMTVTPNEMRAKIGATYLFFSNFIGLSLGAATVGFITSFVFRDDLFVGHSLAIVNVIAAPLATVIIWRGAKPYRSLLDRSES